MLTLIGVVRYTVMLTQPSDAALDETAAYTAVAATITGNGSTIGAHQGPLYLPVLVDSCTARCTYRRRGARARGSARWVTATHHAILSAHAARRSVNIVVQVHTISALQHRSRERDDTYMTSPRGTSQLMVQVLGTPNRALESVRVAILGRGLVQERADMEGVY